MVLRETLYTSVGQGQNNTAPLLVMLINRDPARNPAKHIALISLSGISDAAAGGSQVHCGPRSKMVIKHRQREAQTNRWMNEMRDKWMFW